MTYTINDDYLTIFDNSLIPMINDLEYLGIDAYVHTGCDQGYNIIVVRFKNVDDMNLYKLAGSYRECFDVELMIGMVDYDRV